jgi:hypothetical protein
MLGITFSNQGNFGCCELILIEMKSIPTIFKHQFLTTPPVSTAKSEKVTF